MHSLAGKVVAGGVLGLPSLSRKKPRRTSSGPPRLRRTWTLTSGTGDGATSSTAMAALPIPFMEVSVSVLDTLDVLRSSIEEEVVFQATLGVPAHHALACRIEAYDSPFVRAPDLVSAPQQLSEQDAQFAACLASPPDVDEVHNVSVQRAADTSSFIQRSAPSIRFASGVLTVSLSLKQRSTDLDAARGEGQLGDEDEGEGLCTGVSATHTPHTMQRADSLGHTQRTMHMQRHSSGQLGTDPAGDLGSSTHQGSSSSSGGQHQHRLARLASTCAPIPEGPAGAEADAGTVTASAAAASAAAGSASGARRSLEQQRMASVVSRPAGLLRIRSFTAHGRHTSEVPLTTQFANKGVATLLGIGYIILHAWESRMQPSTNYWQYQVHGAAGSSKPGGAASAPVWPQAAPGSGPHA